jgi:hypothetical protein
MEELGLLKNGPLPKLQSATLVEHSSCFIDLSMTGLLLTPTDPTTLISWSIPESVKRVCDDNGVHLEVQLRTVYSLRAR